jgi:nitrate/TMAO reductase-like tetraheme cytochrome c subunit
MTNTENSAKKPRNCRVFVAGFVAAILVFAGVHWLSAKLTTSHFCGTTCHEMVGVYKGWQVSPHHDNSAGIIVDCKECHLPPENRYAANLSDKIYEGVKNTCLQFFGPPYDANAMRNKVLATMPDSRCLKCHNNLLAKPSSSAARLAHESSLNKSDPNAPRCVEVCHDVMHERKQ